MSAKEKILFAWSGGKDSAMALSRLENSQIYDVVGLITTVTKDYERISIHGVRETLLEAQAKSLGIPLEKIYLSKLSSNEEYEEKMRATLLRAKAQGVTAVAFGDIFLEDLKKYREENLAKVQMKGIFPIWKWDTVALARHFIDQGFKAVAVSLDSKFLGQEFAGREFDLEFLRELPKNVDPCGENGEFHSFVYAGPIFKEPIHFERGEVVLREGRFWYCDLLPVVSVESCSR
ncbi:MAG: diphthine--ammonia ligase [Parcubacteria group bacterium]|nr:diphthine--ammonia ligase [Parcubacteria group bacterium]